MDLPQFRLHPSQPQNRPWMNSVASRLRSNLFQLRAFCTSSSSSTCSSLPIHTLEIPSKPSPRRSAGIRTKVSEAELRENWLASLSCPLPQDNLHLNGSDAKLNGDSTWVLGVDPDISGALAVLKTDDSGCSAEVYDSPHVKVPVGKRIRRRLDAKSIVQLLQNINAPLGTAAYVEQSIPFPRDGKQGWWSGGFAYGLWIGVLVALGFSVVPVPSVAWKNSFELSGSRFSKDDSRRVASALFPSVSPLLKRKKDHGRAEALLIAAYGKGLKINNGS